jgi:hypothetical protein
MMVPFSNFWPSFSKPIDGATLRVLSLGAGVQSSALAIAASRGDIGPRPDFAVFANAGRERKKVYDWLAWLTPQLAFPVFIAQREGLDLGELTLAVARGERPLSGSPIPPLFLADPEGVVPKQCSKEFKTRVVSKFIRDRLGLAPGERAPKHFKIELWLGISMDEIARAKRNEIPWFTNRFPLIEAGLSRRDCISYLTSIGFPEPPKSSCIWCPFRRKAQWKEMRDNEADDFSAACDYDDAWRIIPGLTGRAYISDERIPLRDLDLDGDLGGQVDLFADECEGMCGV